MKAFGRFLMVALAALLLASCSSAGPDLEGVTWELETLNGKAILADSQVTLRFEGDQIQGKASCNSYFGEYAVKGGTEWSVGMIGNTEMFCMQPEGIMDQETAYLKALREADSISLAGDKLSIDGNGVELLFHKG